MKINLLKSKKLIYCVLILMIQFTNISLSFAQDTCEYVRVKGNECDTIKIGSKNNTDVEIITDNQERIKIKSDGGTNVYGGTNTNADTSYQTNIIVGPTLVWKARLDVSTQYNSTLPAILGRVSNPAHINNIAIQAISQPQAGFGYGIKSEGGKRGLWSLNDAGSSNSSTYGIYSESKATGNGINVKRYGIYAVASGGTEGSRYGVYGIATGGNAASCWAGYFSGNVKVDGNVTAANFFQNSDRILKVNIQKEKSSLEKLLELEPVTYTFKPEYQDRLGLPDNLQHGLIAQEVETIFPELVKNQIQESTNDTEKDNETGDEFHYKSLNYIGLIPVLIQAVKEQQVLLQKQQQEIDILKRKISEKNGFSETQINTSRNSKNNSEYLSGSEILSRMEQNFPNPANQSTVIRYNISEKCKKAEIVLYRYSDQKIVYELTPGKEGLLNIDTYNMPTGEYVYELWVDNARAEAKKMIIVK